MSTENEPFALASLEVGDTLQLSGDGFDAEFVVLEAGETPSCLMHEGNEDSGIEHVQLIGHMPYHPQKFWNHLFVGCIDYGGQIVFACGDDKGMPTIQQRSLVEITVMRRSLILFYKRES